MESKHFMIKGLTKILEIFDFKGLDVVEFDYKLKASDAIKARVLKKGRISVVISDHK